MLNGNAMIIFLIVRLIKKILLDKMSYFPESYSSSKNKIQVELDLFNYATKSGLNNAAGVDTSEFTKKTDLANLKSDVDELDTDKLKNVPNGLSSRYWYIRSYSNLFK